MKNLKLYPLALLAAFALPLASSSSADAQTRPGRTANAPRAVRGAKPLVNRAKQFKPTAVSSKLKQKLGNREVMIVTKKNAGAYEKAMKKDTIEVMFKPHASRVGHIYIRVGDRLIDMPGPGGARNNSFISQMKWGSSAMYGFTFKVGEKRVASLKKSFETLINSRPTFGMAAGGPTCFSCAAFVTHVLATEAPELKISKSISAIGVGRRMLNNSSVHAVTLYHSAAEKSGSEQFSFEKID